VLELPLPAQASFIIDYLTPLFIGKLWLRRGVSVFVCMGIISLVFLSPQKVYL
jgi:hypothetical protein